MTDEIFMQLLELVGTAGEGGFILTVLWLALDFLIEVSIVALLTFAVLTIGRIIRGAIRSIRTLKTIAGMFSIQWSGDLNESEAQNILNALNLRLKEVQ